VDFQHAPHALGLSAMVSDKHERDARALLQVDEQVRQRSSILFVERTGRFIGKNRARLIDQGTHHSDTLAFTARELCGR